MLKLSLLPLALFTSACVLDSSADPAVTESTDQDLTLGGGVIGGGSPCPTNTPASLAPADDQELAFSMPAQGVQRYACVQSTTGFAWVFVAPAADLFDPGIPFFAVHHFAGPTWLASDSSSVLAAKAAAATVDTTAIPWLLLNVTSHGGGKGRMTNINQIQRLETTGGLAPATGCDADHVGMQSDVLYTARYFFYRTSASGHGLRCGG